jgi:hypothetical protein
MDGRIQEPLRAWMAERFGLRYVDTVTQPGMDGVLAGSTDLGDAELAKKMVNISVGAHGSRTVVVSGHHDCAGNPVGREQHKEDIKKAVDAVKSWDGMAGIQVIGVWINENWQVEPVTQGT